MCVAARRRRRRIVGYASTHDVALLSDRMNPRIEDTRSLLLTGFFALLRLLAKLISSGGNSWVSLLRQ